MPASHKIVSHTAALGPVAAVVALVKPNRISATTTWIGMPPAR